jgi:hypothetical protein
MKYLRHEDDINLKIKFFWGRENNLNENNETYPHWTNIGKYSDGHRPMTREGKKDKVKQKKRNFERKEGKRKNIP